MVRFLTALFLICCQGIVSTIRQIVTGAFKAWNRFWFTPIDPSVLGIMRIFSGGMILYTHVIWTLRLDDFFGPNGWQGHRLLASFHSGRTFFTFWQYVPEHLRWPMHWLSLIVLVLFVIGYKTRITAILTYIIVVSYAQRVPMANFGLDQMNGIAALYLAIGPCGSAFSLDRWLEKRKFPERTSIAPSVMANVATRLVQVHLCVIYTFAGISKLQGELWWNGFAVWNAAANLEYQSNSLLWLAHVPWLCQILTLTTIAWEISFWTLVWNRKLRPFVLFVGAMMHLGIGAFLGMWTFGLAMVFMYLSFLPPEVLFAMRSRWRAAFILARRFAASSSAVASDSVSTSIES